MRRWMLNFIEITILVFISLTCFVSVLQNTFLKEKSVFGYRNYVIASDSMEPTLEYGDIILIKEVEYDGINVGDIITYMGEVDEYKDKVITHKVIEIINEEDGSKIFRTKGDANDVIDPLVTEDQVYGKVVYKFVIFSFFSKMIRHEVGLICFLFIPIVILIILEFISIIKECRRRELENRLRIQINKLKRSNKTNKNIMLENTMVLQLEHIKEAKRDLKKIKELEKEISVSLNDIEDNVIENEQLLEDTLILFNYDDLKKEISREIKIKNKKNKRNRRRKGNNC